MPDNLKQPDLELNDKKQVQNDGPVECLGMKFPSDDDRRKHFLKLLAQKSGKGGNKDSNSKSR